jgi:hypothetical protein
LVKVELEVKNICDDVIKFIKLNTPFELMMVNGGIFEVLDEHGKNVPYNGMMSYLEPLESCVSPGSPSACYFQSVWPGNNPVWGVMDLTKGYTFNPGIYKVRFLGANATGLPSSDFITIEVMAEPDEK